MYGTLAEFKTYCTNALYDITAYTDEQITATLTKAALKLDAEFRQHWVGYRTVATQANDWPRTNAYGSVTNAPYAPDSVPSALVDASYEYCYQMLSGVVRVISSDANTATIKSEKKSLTGGMFKEIEYTTGLSPEDRENQVLDYLTSVILFDLIAKSSGGFSTAKRL